MHIDGTSTYIHALAPKHAMLACTTTYLQKKHVLLFKHVSTRVLHLLPGQQHCSHGQSMSMPAAMPACSPRAYVAWYI
jgi:hypothetical protein